eukprot:6095842-Amphidinium_carterae.1
MQAGGMSNCAIFYSRAPTLEPNIAFFGLRQGQGGLTSDVATGAATLFWPTGPPGAVATEQSEQISLHNTFHTAFYI